MKASTVWKIQLVIGTLMVFYFILVQGIILDISPKIVQGTMIGVSGMLLFWGMREVLGALAKQHKLNKEVER